MARKEESLNPPSYCCKVSLLSRTHLEPRILDVVACPPPPSHGFSMRTLEYDIMGRYKMIYNAAFSLNKTARYISKGTVSFSKCGDEKSYNTCEYFQTWTHDKDCCGLMLNKHAFWAPIASSVVPPIGCPFEAGEYTVGNGSIDTRVLEVLPFPLENNVWVIKFIAWDETREPFMCVDLSLKFLRVRN